MEEITEKLLDKIFYLQEQLAEEKQENTNMKKGLKKCKDIIDYLREERKRQEKRNKNEINQIEERKDKIIGCAIFVGIGFTIFIYLLIKFLLWYFF